MPEPEVGEEAMELAGYGSQLLMATMLSSFRQDDAVARQAVINHQGAAQLAILSFVRDATELSIPESYAVQGLANSQTTRELPQINAGAQAPSPTMAVKPA